MCIVDVGKVNWHKLPGSASRIAVSALGKVFCVNSSDMIYHLGGALKILVYSVQKWNIVYTWIFVCEYCIVVVVSLGTIRLPHLARSAVR